MTGIIWARESNQHDKNEYSIKSQIDACTARAEADGIPVAHTFIEKFSGRDLHRMPRLTEMRRLIEHTSGPKVIYVYAQDRLVRGEDAFDIFFLLVEFRRHNAEVRFILTPVDLTSIAGQIQMLIAGHEASGEIAKILDRTQRGKIKRMQEGKVYGSGTEKYGFTRNKAAGTVSLNQTEAAILRRAARMILEDGMSLTQVCRKFNAEGIPSPLTARGIRQGQWSNASLGRLLRDPAYKGEGYGHRYAKSKDGKSVNLANKAKWIPLPIYPPIFSPQEWDSLQVAIKQKRQAPKRNEGHPALLRGRVICGQCGRTMTYQIDRRNPNKLRTFYECKPQYARHRAERPPRCATASIRESEIDPIVWNLVLSIISAPEKLRESIAARDDSERIRVLQDEAAALRSLLDRKTEQQANLVGQLADTPPAIAHLLHDRLAALEGEKAAIADRLATIDRALSDRPDTSIERIERLAAHIASFDFAHKRRAIELLQIQVLSKDGEWLIYSGFLRLILQRVSADLPHNATG